MPLGVIAAGAIYAYSFPGLFWLAAAAVIYALIVAVAPSVEAAKRRARRRS